MHRDRERGREREREMQREFRREREGEREKEKGRESFVNLYRGFHGESLGYRHARQIHETLSTFLFLAIQMELSSFAVGAK